MGAQGAREDRLVIMLINLPGWTIDRTIDIAKAKEMTMAYLIQEPRILRIPSAKTMKETAYFSPCLAELELMNGASAGTICIAEKNRGHYEAGEKVRAIIILDPLAWLWQDEKAHHFEREQVMFGEVRKKVKST